jgi:hypothetical protein
MTKDRIKHGRSKLISNYGGVGSLIETEYCSVIIETFDNWHYGDLQNRISKYIIRDDRLLNRLKTIFKNLRHIVQIPTEQNTFIDQIYPTSNYFSKWFYCNKCKRFSNYDMWKIRWTGKADKLHPPVCSNPECREEKLEQVRFVMTCPNGHIDDVPWRHWNILSDDANENTEKADEENQKTRGLRIDLTRTCCDNQDLVYQISRENTELSGIFIKCKSCGEHRSLSSIFNYERPCTGRKYWNGQINGQFDNENCERKMKVVVKSSNSVYYANTISSIFIPETQSPLDNETRVEIDNALDSGSMSKEEIIKFFSISKKIPQEIIRSYFETGDTSYIPDVAFREEEYNYFLKTKPPEDQQIKFRLIDCKNILYGFEKVIRIDKLKRIVVQTSFTRQEPIDVDSVLLEQGHQDYGYAVKRQPISKNNFETRLLPGIECYGEGILFVIDKQQIEKWETQPQVIDRINKIKQNAESSSWKYHKVLAKSVTPRKILIHTLSHLLMRGLEYVCGYSVASLSER